MIIIYISNKKRCILKSICIATVSTQAGWDYAKLYNENGDPKSLQNKWQVSETTVSL